MELFDGFSINFGKEEDIYLQTKTTLMPRDLPKLEF